MVPIVADWTGEVQRGRSARRAQSAAREVRRPRHARRARVSADAAVRGATKMMRRQSAARLFLGAASVLALCVGSAGQGLDPAALLKPAVDSWPTYHGDYSGQRHSPLTQITPGNVSQLTLAWVFQTGQSAQIKATPILVNGIMYVSAPDQLWAIDARSGRQLWQYRYPENARRDERRRHGRADVDDRHLRSAARSRVRRHRQSDAGAERQRAARRQSLDLQHRRDPSRDRQARMGISGDAARHPRLGCVGG